MACSRHTHHRKVAPKSSKAKIGEKLSFLDLPRELRDSIYEHASDTIRQHEIERGFDWAGRALIRALPCFNLLLCCQQVKREYMEELARHPPRSTFVIEIREPPCEAGWRHRLDDHPWWDSARCKSFESRLSMVHTLELIYHISNPTLIHQHFGQLRENLESVINLDDRKRTKFVCCLDMESLRRFLHSYGNILPASNMRDTSYSETYFDAGDEDYYEEVEIDMRQRRSMYDNETVTIVHDNLFCVDRTINDAGHPKNRIAYVATLTKPELQPIVRGEPGYEEAVRMDNVEPSDLSAVRLEVLPALTGSFEEFEADMAQEEVEVSSS